jgi:hypothetical protein
MRLGTEKIKLLLCYHFLQIFVFWWAHHRRTFKKYKKIACPVAQNLGKNKDIVKRTFSNHWLF